MSITLSKPKRKLTLVSVRRVYRCKEHSQWRIEFVHYTAGESSPDPYPNRWQVWRLWVSDYFATAGAGIDGCDLTHQNWQLVSEHRTKAAAIKAVGKAIREAQRPKRKGRA